MRVYVILIFIMLLVFACKHSFENNNSEPTFKLPAHENAEKIKHFSRGGGKITEISYQIDEPFPSQKILHFYQSFFTNFGFNDFTEEHRKEKDRKWQIFQDATRPNNPIVAQLTASWINESNNKRANLLLRYYWEIHPPRFLNLPSNSNLFVDVQLTPLVRLPPPPKM